MDYRNIIDKSITNNYSNILRILKKNIPLSYLFFFLRTVLWQRKAMRSRSHWKKKGVNVPPIMIASVTKRCNLKLISSFNNINKIRIEKSWLFLKF